MLNILHWTEGQGTGHIKRANAILQAATAARNDFTYSVEVKSETFFHLLPPSARCLDASAPLRFDLIVLDLEDPLVDESILGCAERWIQLCRLGSPLDAPKGLEAEFVQLSFEDCLSNRERKMPFFGSLLDASPAKLLSRCEGRALLEGQVGRPLPELLALTHANSANSHQAARFLGDAISDLLSRFEIVVVGTGHQSITKALYEKYGERIAVVDLNPIYRFYAVFEELTVPVGYNTYQEVGLFFDGKVNFAPMYPPDQLLRWHELPTVHPIANTEVFNYILDFASS